MIDFTLMNFFLRKQEPKNDEDSNCGPLDIRGHAALELANQKYFDKGIFDESVLDYCDEAIAFGVFEAYSLRAICLMKMELYYSAICDFNQAIKILPNDANLYSSRGLCRAYIGDKETALKDMAYAIKISELTNDENLKLNVNAIKMGFNSSRELFQKLYEYISSDYYIDKKSKRRSDK